MKSINTSLKFILKYIAVVVFFLVLSYGFVPQVLGGKIVNQSDISSWKGMTNEANSYNAEHPDDKTYWTNSMFGGMPTTATIDDFDGDLTKHFYKTFLLGKRPASYLFIALLSSFLLMLAFGMNLLPAIGASIAIAFCSYNMQIIQVGHNTKMQAIAFFPMVLAGLVYAYKCILIIPLTDKNTVSANDGDNADSTKKFATFSKNKYNWLLGSVIGSLLFAFALSFQIKANHPQITYYLALTIFAYAITLFIWILCKKQKKLIGRFFIVSAFLLVFGCIGIATNANKLIPTYNYSKYTMRGGSELVKEGEDGSDGLDIEYATSWSYGLNEMPNLLIPNFNGGCSSCNPDLKKSATESLLRRAGQTNIKETMNNLPMYWGPQPFTAGPMYMGAISIFLFVLALLLVKGKEKWWILCVSLLACMLSWGYHFLWFTKLCFNYLPMYNKFRTVSMSLVVLQTTIPLLAFICLDKILKLEYDWKKAKKALAWALGITGGFCLLMYLFPSIAGSFSGAADSQMQDILVNALIEDRKAMLKNDAFRSLLLIVSAAIVLFWYMLKKDKLDGRKRYFIAAASIIALILIDLIPVGKRYLNETHFITPKSFDNQFEKRLVDEIILEDTDINYRVLDLSVNTFNSAYPSYHHKCIGGYSPVKLQRYQDLIERYISGEINQCFAVVKDCETISEVEEKLPFLKINSLLNAKYIILGDNYAPVHNKYAFGNCWFVDSFVQAATTNEEIDLLKTTDLRNSVVLGPDFKHLATAKCFNKDCPDYSDESEDIYTMDGVVVGTNEPDYTDESEDMHTSYNKIGDNEIEHNKTAIDQIELVEYAPNRLKYKFSCSSERMAVFSEIYYPEGWKGKIKLADNSEYDVDINRVDWMLRSIILPQGEGEITMEFEPQSYKIGKNISMASSITLLVLLLISLLVKFLLTRFNKLL